MRGDGCATLVRSPIGTTRLALRQRSFQRRCGPLASETTVAEVDDFFDTLNADCEDGVE
jgi:hypothetical protein